MALTKAHNRMIEGDVVNVLDFGATGDGTTDDTTAIQAAIDSLGANGGEIFFPNGTYKLSNSLVATGRGIHLAGESSDSTVLQMASSAVPILQVGGVFNIVERLTLEHTPSLDYDEANGICLNLVDSVYHSSFRDLRLTGGAYGMKLTTKNTSTATCFSNTFDNFYIFPYSNIGIDIASVASGSTGNVFNNIYINGTRSGSVGNTLAGVALSAVNESVFNQLNIEHADLANAITIYGGETLLFNGLHFEGLTPRNGPDGTNANFSGFIRHTQNVVQVNQLSIINCTFNNSYTTNYSVMHSTDGAKSEIHGLVTRTNTNTGGANIDLYTKTGTNQDEAFCFVWNPKDRDGNGQISFVTEDNVFINGWPSAAYLSAINDTHITASTPTIVMTAGGRRESVNFADGDDTFIYGELPEIVKNWNEFKVKAVFTQPNSTAGVARLQFTYEPYSDGDDLNVTGTSYSSNITASGTANELSVEEVTASSVTVTSDDFQAFRFRREGSNAADTLTDAVQLLGLQFVRIR